MASDSQNAADTIIAMNGHWLIMEFLEKEVYPQHLLTGLFALGNLVQNGQRWKDADLGTCTSILCGLAMRRDEIPVVSEIFQVLLNIGLRKIRHVFGHMSAEFLHIMVSYQ